jgi:hypothetical protein
VACPSREHVYEDGYYTRRMSQAKPDSDGGFSDDARIGRLMSLAEIYTACNTDASYTVM